MNSGDLLNISREAAHARLRSLHQKDVIYPLPAWPRSPVQKPVLYRTRRIVAAYDDLYGQTQQRLFCALFHARPRYDLFHWRNKHGTVMDFVLERGGVALCGLKVASHPIRSRQSIRGVLNFSRRYDLPCFVVTPGDRLWDPVDGVAVVPVERVLRSKPWARLPAQDWNSQPL